MALIRQCDGCGHKIDGDPTNFGIVVGVEYCPDCAVKGREMKAEVDALHDKCAETWRKGLEKIRKKYGADLKGLPDVS